MALQRASDDLRTEFSNSGDSDDDLGELPVLSKQGKSISDYFRDKEIQAQTMELSTETAQKMLSCGLSQQNLAILELTTRHVMGSGGSLTTSTLQSVAHAKNRMQNEDHSGSIEFSGGSVSKRTIYSMSNKLSSEGYTLLVKSSCLPDPGVGAVEISKLGDEDAGTYYTKTPRNGKSDCFIAKLEFERRSEVSTKQKRTISKDIIIVKNSPVEDTGYLIEMNPSVSKSQAMSQATLYQVNTVYCSPHPPGEVAYKMPEGENPSTFTVLWVLGPQKWLMSTFFVLIEDSSMRPGEELKTLKKFAQPSQVNDESFINDLLESLQKKETASNHPGMCAHYKLRGENPVLYKVTTVSPVATFTRPDLSTENLRALMSNTFRYDFDDSTCKKLIKRYVYDVKAKVLKTIKTRRGGANTISPIDLHVFLDLGAIEALMKEKKTTRFDTSILLQFFKKNLKNTMAEPGKNYYEDCRLLESGFMGFRDSDGKSIFTVHTKALPIICTGQYSYTEMENPDNLDRVTTLVQDGYGDRDVDLLFTAAAKSVQKQVSMFKGRIRVTDVKVTFCNTDRNKIALPVVRRIINHSLKNDKYTQLTNCCVPADKKKLDLHMCVISLACLVILSPQVVSLPTILERIVNAIGSDFDFEKLVEDPDNFLTQDVTGKNALYVITATILGTITWTVDKLLMSEGQSSDSIRVEDHERNIDLKSYIKNICLNCDGFDGGVLANELPDCNFNPGVVLYYLANVRLNPGEGGEKSPLEAPAQSHWKIASHVLMELKKESTYKSKPFVADNDPEQHDIPVVFGKFQYKSFSEVKLLPEPRVRLQDFLDSEDCEKLDDESDSDDEAGQGGPPSKRARI